MMKMESKCLGMDEPEINILAILHMLQHKIAKTGNKWLAIKGLDVKIEQIPVLMLINKKKDITQIEIANTIERDKSSVFRTVNSLTGKGLVECKKDSKNKRKSLLNLTQKGEGFVAAIENEVNSFENIFIEKLTKENYDNLKENLINCNQIINDLYNEL